MAENDLLVPPVAGMPVGFVLTGEIINLERQEKDPANVNVMLFTKERYNPELTLWGDDGKVSELGAAFLKLKVGQTISVRVRLGVSPKGQLRIYPQEIL